MNNNYTIGLAVVFLFYFCFIHSEITEWINSFIADENLQLFLNVLILWGVGYLLIRWFSQNK